jgi:hypothetical protein
VHKLGWKIRPFISDSDVCMRQPVGGLQKKLWARFGPGFMHSTEPVHGCVICCSRFRGAGRCTNKRAWQILQIEIDLLGPLLELVKLRPFASLMPQPLPCLLLLEQLGKLVVSLRWFLQQCMNNNTVTHRRHPSTLKASESNLEPI